MEKYKAEVTITLKHPNGLNEEWKRVCELSIYFHAVAGSNIDLMLVDESLWYTEITNVYGKILPCPGVNLAIEGEVNNLNTVEKFLNLRKGLKKKGWKKVSAE